LEGVASGVITLGESPDAEHLLQDLLARPPGEPPRLNASAVTHLSVPALQVLLSAMRETAAGGGRLVIQDPSFALNLAFEAFGFAGSNEPFTVEYT
jgi:anti-anti-sigma regulatory factor